MPPTRTPSPDPGESPIRDRGDACPGALRLHLADDGRLARLRLPGGLLTAHQVEVLGDVAERLADGNLSVTSRGNIELRGLGETCGGELSRLLADAGLLPSERHERVRNVVASPLATTDGLGHADVQLWARELDGLLCGAEWTTQLSGRFLFVLDDGRGDVAGLGGDVTLIAESGGTAVVRVAGRAFRIAAADAPRAALAAAGAFLTAAHEAGNGAWRVRELPPGRDVDVAGALEGAGVAVTRVAVPGAPTAPQPPPAAPGASTAVPGASGAVPQSPPVPQSPTALPQPPTAVPGASVALPYGSDPVPEVPTALPETSAPKTSTPPTAPAVTPDVPVTRPPPPGVHGRAVLVNAPLGRVGVDAWRALLPLPGGELRVTPWRGFVLPGFADEGAARERLAALRDAGYLTTPDSPWLGVGACTGRPGCAKSRADVRADVVPGPGGLPVHWSGCERRCGHPHGDWVDVLATGEGRYEVTVHAPGEEPARVTGRTLTETVTTARTTTKTTATR
ncbi:cobalamin biosynthesis protein CobG [Streptomyces sp. NPDC048518]|uniref:cobalamin biosynthesis protein CobG n=1 Tax=Streptomyces sp. NPDC048518 TaxID=3155029 RepID=UPI003401BA05